MKVNKAYKFRLYPSKSQITYIEGCFNACRYVYNITLDCEEQLYTLGAKSNLSSFGLSYHLKYYKINSSWLNDYDSLALAYEMENLASSYKKFFEGIKNKSGAGYPKFKSKYENKPSFRTRMKIEVVANGIKIPRLKTIIPCKLHREVEGKPKQMTISRENGKYFVSIMVEMDITIPEFPTSNVNEVGIDLGIKTFLVRSDNKQVDNPNFINSSAAHMKKLQQNLAKAKKGSNNYIKIKKSISNLHESTSNKRSDFLHNTSTNLINEFDRIYMEDLSIVSMSKSKKGTIDEPGENVKQKSKLNKSILDVGLGTFKTMLEYKAKFSGKEVVKVGKFFASSKICHSCTVPNKNLLLSERIWTCDNCGSEIERDLNAAKNIRDEGRRILISKK